MTNAMTYQNYIHSVVHDKTEEQFVINALPTGIRIQDVVSFDIETTGIDPMKSVVTGISSTFMTEDNIPKTVQFFLTGKEHEKEMLELFYLVLKDKQYLVSFNGDTFDIPYVSSKFNQYDIPFNIEAVSHLDLYKWAKKYQNANVAIQRKSGVSEDKIKKPFGQRLTLKAIENFAGIHRDDEIFGVTMIEKYHQYEFYYKTSIVDDMEEFEIRLSLIKDKTVYPLYVSEGKESVQKYLKEKAEAIRNDMCLHNREDTYNLLKLFGILSDKIYNK